MHSPFASSPLPPLHVGQRVHVNNGPLWLTGVVTGMVHRLVDVTFRGTMPAHYRGPVAAHLVWPADGFQLRKATRLQPGDQVIGLDGHVQTVDTLWRGRDGLVVAYTDGQSVTLPPSAVLRLPT